MGLGSSLENSFVLARFVTSNLTNTKLLVVAFLYDDDNKVSHPLVRSLVRSGSRFLNDIHNRGQVLYESYNVTLDFRKLLSYVIISLSLNTVIMMQFVQPLHQCLLK